MEKWVYTFGDGRAEGSAGDRNLLGGKGANLAEMCNLGLPVPPGLTIVTSACNHYYDNGRMLPDGLKDQVRAGIRHMEAITGRVFGDTTKPLLLSVRSGARASRPRRGASRSCTGRRRRRDRRARRRTRSRTPSRARRRRSRPSAPS